MIVEYLKLNDFRDIFTSIFQHPIFKTMTTFFISFASFGFDLSREDVYYALVILILVDCFTAMLAAYNTGIQIRSSRFFRTPVKLVIYFGLIFVTHISGYAVPYLSEAIDTTMISFLTMTELISILENVHKLGYEVPNSLIRRLINIKNEK